MAGAVLLLLLGTTVASQDGAKRTLQFSKKCLFVSPYQSGAVADINRDGHLDVVSGPYWFAGPDYVPRSFRANHGADNYRNTNSDLVYDLDGDGWIDVIVGSWGEDGIFWFKNPGAIPLERGLPWESQLLTKTRGRMERYDFHDFDGDQIPEIYTACYRKEEPLEIWRFIKNPENGAPALEQFVLGTQGGGHGYAFGDVNGDGREDVLCEVGWHERPLGNPFAQPWTFHSETALPHPSCPFAVTDLNQDGRLDVLFGRGHDYGLYWWEQQAPKPDGTTDWKKHVIDDSWSQAHVVALADLDGDGREELVTGKCVRAHEQGDPETDDPAVLYYYTWDPAASTFTRHTIVGPGENIGLGRQIAIADLNRDGRPDLASGPRQNRPLATDQ